MKKMKKSWRWVMPVLAAVIVTVPVLSGCSKEEEPQEIGADVNVMNIGGYDVTKEEYDYYFLNEKYSLDQGDNTFWDTATDEQKNLKERAESGLKEFYAMKKMADEAGIPTDGTLAEEVDAQIAAMVEQYGGQEVFDQLLEESYLTADMYRMMSIESFRSIELFKHMMGDEIKATLPDRYLRAAHILIKFNENAVDTAADHEQAKKRAEEVLEKVNAGEDFFKLVEEYGEDPGMVNNLDGYYFTEGEMVEPFYEGAIALKEGETSGLVETTYGYHIIKRLPMENAYIDENLMDFATQEQYQAFVDKLDEAINSIEVKKEDVYNSITLENAIKAEAKNA